MGKLEHWKGIKKAELRSIPVVCGACGQQVSIDGRIEEGVMIWEDCPACKAPIDGYLVMAGDDVKKEALPLRAAVTWYVDGGPIPEASIVVGKTTEVLDVLLRVLTSGVGFFSHPELPQQALYFLLAKFITERLVMLKDLPILAEAINQRIAAQPDIPSDIVCKSGLYSGGNGGHAKPLTILNLKQESDDNDG